MVYEKYIHVFFWVLWGAFSEKAVFFCHHEFGPFRDRAHQHKRGESAIKPEKTWLWKIPSGKLRVCYGTSPCFIGISTLSMSIFNSYVKLPEGKVGKV